MSKEEGEREREGERNRHRDRDDYQQSKIQQICLSIYYAPHIFLGGQMSNHMVENMLDMIFFFFPTEDKYYRSYLNTKLHKCKGSGSVKPGADGNSVTESS